VCIDLGRDTRGEGPPLHGVGDGWHGIHDEPDTDHDESDTGRVEFANERGERTERRCDSDITSDRSHPEFRWFYVPKPGDDRDAVGISDFQSADLTDDARKLDQDQPERKYAADDCDASLT
jgi:hypothetical protein